MSEPSRFVGGLAVLLAVGSGLYGSIFWIGTDPGPGAEAFPPAAKVIRDAHRPGDLIVLAPFYATRAREQLGDLDVVAPKEPLLEDFGPHPRIWVFGLFGAAESLRDGMKAQGLELEESLAPSAGIVVDRYRNLAPTRVELDLVKAIDQAKVFHENNGQLIPCSEWSRVDGAIPGRGKWVCPYDKDWFYVGPEWHRMGNEQRLCLWAHPPREGRLVVRYSNVPMTGRLFGHAGHTLNASVHAKAPVWLDVAIGDQIPQRFEVAVEDTWRSIGLVTPTTGTATITVSVSTANNGMNHFCFALDARRASP